MANETNTGMQTTGNKRGPKKGSTRVSPITSSFEKVNAIIADLRGENEDNADACDLLDTLQTRIDAMIEERATAVTGGKAYVAQLHDGSFVVLTLSIRPTKEFQGSKYRAMYQASGKNVAGWLVEQSKKDPTIIAKNLAAVFS